MTTPASTTHITPRVEPFPLIVCGVDGSIEALEGVRQAGVLAGPDSTIEIVAMVDEPELGKLAVQRATAELAASPARVLTRTVTGHPAAERLLAEAGAANLVVVARSAEPRRLLHRAHVPVLLAAPPTDGVFPQRILVAADGPDHPEHAIRLAALIAQEHDSEVTLLRVDWGHRPKRRAVAEAVAELTEVLGQEPEEIIMGGSAAQLIPDYARSEGASLVITGSRNLAGLGSLRSVSERVAHTCDCSVLTIKGIWRRPR